MTTKVLQTRQCQQCSGNTFVIAVDGRIYCADCRKRYMPEPVIVDQTMTHTQVYSDGKVVRMTYRVQQFNTRYTESDGLYHITAVAQEDTDDDTEPTT